MTPQGLAFYAVGAGVLAATALAVTRRDPVHAVLWLVASFLGTALLFAQLGAPMLAAYLVILYAGGILVLFLFVVMMLRGEPARLPGSRRSSPARRAAAVAGPSCLGAVLWFLSRDPGWAEPLTYSLTSPRELGHFLFTRYALCVEVVSVALFVPLAAALLLGREQRRGPAP